MKIDRIDLQVNMRWLIESDFWHGVIFSRWHPLLDMQQFHLLAHQVRATSLAYCMCYSSWSLVYSYLLLNLFLLSLSLLLLQSWNMWGKTTNIQAEVEYAKIWGMQTSVISVYPSCYHQLSVTNELNHCMYVCVHWFILLLSVVLGSI